MFDARKCIDNAVACCISSNREFSSREDVIKSLAAQDRMTHSRIRISIARDVVKCLQDKYDGIVLDARLYGSTAEYQAGIFSDIDIVIRLKSEAWELSDNVKFLDRMIASEYYSLLGIDKSEWSYLLDIHIINDAPSAPCNPSYAYLQYIFENDSVAI